MIQKLKNIKIEDFANNVDRLRLYRLEQIKKSEPLKKNIIKIFRLSLVVLSFILILFILYQSKNNYITSLYSVLIPIFLFVTAYFISKNSILKKQKLTFHNDSENSVIGFPDSNCLNDFPDELIINSKNSGDILADKEREQNFSCFFEANFFESFKRIAIENKIIEDSGKYIFSKIQRHLTILIGKLLDKGFITKECNKRNLHISAKAFFLTNIDYPEMTTIINECKNNELAKKDKLAYNKLSVFDKTL
ncbi:hypothetical protein [Flavobacterium yafengii]|uniref:hypothetical protein n=1 Tax=Flavobacterium yafengii TaxID=3041253 RepID=UPI0024A94DE3|nr:hypothetical protein [Flavobacterium yafengii]MDI6046191.1 hypothetical protein [Flavobacterium yafengii]